MKYNKCDSEIILKPTHLEKFLSWILLTQHALSSAHRVTKILKL